MLSTIIRGKRGHAGMQGYVNLKGYEEFDSSIRSTGGRKVTFWLSPAAAPPPTAPKRPKLTK